jgi:hypothetical protein
VSLHIHATSAKRYSFSFQAQALFDCRVSAELNFASGAQYPLPWQIEGPAQRGNHLPGGSGISSSPGDGTIG